MIVRDEASIIEATLATLVDHLDTWVVIDTGSTAGTPEVVRSYFERAGIPGELVERPWVNFGHNRTEAFELCRGRADYAFVHDADDALRGSLDLSGLSAPGYLLRMRFA